MRITFLILILVAISEHLLICAEPESEPGPSYRVYLTGGAVFQNPYTISLDPATTTAKLEKRGTQTEPFLEFAYINRFVLREKDADPHAKSFFGHSVFSTDMETDDIQYFWPIPFARMPEVESRIGFVMKDSTGPTNYSASTIAGGGNFYSDGSLGFPFMRYISQEDGSRQQVSIQFGGGVVTDKDFLSVHPTAFAGMGYQYSFEIGNGADSRRGYFFGRAGYGWIDTPKFLDSDSLNVRVARGLPQFHLAGAPTLGVYLAYPLTKTINLTVGSNVYIRDSPSPWTITVGATLDLEKVAAVFGSFLK